MHCKWRLHFWFPRSRSHRKMCTGKSSVPVDNITLCVVSDITVPYFDVTDPVQRLCSVCLHTKETTQQITVWQVRSLVCVYMYACKHVHGWVCVDACVLHSFLQKREWVTQNHHWQILEKYVLAQQSSGWLTICCFAVCPSVPLLASQSLPVSYTHLTLPTTAEV